MADDINSGNTGSIDNDSLKYLSNVPQSQYFVMSNGWPIANLEELYDKVRDSDDAVFYHHVTADRNDFANWIKYCVLCDPLFEKLNDIRQKEVFLGVLAEEIAIFKNPKLAQTIKYFTEDPSKSALPVKDLPAEASTTKSSTVTETVADIPVAPSVVVQVAVSAPAPAPATPSLAAASSSAAPAVISPVAPVIASPAAPVVVSPITVPLAEVPISSAVVVPVAVSSVPGSTTTDDSTVSPANATTVPFDVHLPPSQAAESSVAASSPEKTIDNDAKNSIVGQILGDVFEFEQIMKSIIDEVEKEISAWDS